MKKLALTAIAASALSAQIVLPPGVTVRPGQEYRFYGKCPGKVCKFELGDGHDATSSITTDGLYTAPSSARPRAKLGGCPLMPLSTIFNTPIDKLPLDPNSVAMVNQIVARAIGGTGTLHLGPTGSPIVPVDDKTQKVFLQSTYQNLGTGSWPLGTPPYLRVGSKDRPKALNQVGWRITDIDNRVTEVDINTCASYEYYFYGSIETSLENPKISPVTAKLANISAYGVSNTMDWDNALNKPVGLNGSANASGMWHQALQMDVEELMQSVDIDGVNANLKHLIGFTLPNTNIRPYNSKDHRWPAILWAGGYTDGLVPYGTRFRLKQTFVEAFPYAQACITAGTTTGIGIISQLRCQNAIRGIFNTIRDYGVIMMDGTTQSDSGGMHVRSHGKYDPDWYAAAWAFSNAKNRGWGNALASLEAVNEQALMVDEKSNLVRDKVANPEVVKYLDVTNATAPVILDVRDVIVYPPTLGALATQFSVVAGAEPLDLAYRNVWASGFKDNSAISWSIISGPGVIGDGEYIPPQTLTMATTTVVRAAHTEDAAQYVDIRIVNFPPVGRGLCIRAAASQPGNTTDKLGRTCWSFDNGKVQVNPFATSLQGNLMQVVSQDPAFPNGGVWRSGTSSEQMAHFQLPNGRYKVSALAVTPYGNPMSSTVPYDPVAVANANKTAIDINGQITYGPENLFIVIGAPNNGKTISSIVDVTDGTLIFGWRIEGKFGGGSPYLAGILIEEATKRGGNSHASEK